MDQAVALHEMDVRPERLIPTALTELRIRASVAVTAPPLAVGPVVAVVVVLAKPGAMVLAAPLQVKEVVTVVTACSLQSQAPQPIVLVVAVVALITATTLLMSVPVALVAAVVVKSTAGL